MILPPPLQPIACHAMGSGWNTHKVRLFFFLPLILLLEIQGCFSLNSEGLALLKFRREVDYDPFGALANWNLNDSDPCIWSGVHCVDGKVQMLYLDGLSLEGVLASELGNLTHLRCLVLSKNIFSGTIPKELGQLSMLEVLDLRNNYLSGTIPAEIGGLQSLKQLLLCNNKFEGGIPSELANLNLISEVEIDEDLASAIANGNGCINRKFAHLFKSGKYLLDTNVDYCNDNPPSVSQPLMVQNVYSSGNIVRRRLTEQASNLAALPASSASMRDHIIALPSSRSSGSFPAVPIRKKGPPPHLPEPQQDKPPTPSTSSPDKNYSASTEKHTGGTSWKSIVGISVGCFILIAAAAMLLICRTKAVRTIGPWKSGLSGQLQKAFVTGVPKLNRTELETACEDFSNIVYTLDGCTIYKGTLSNGVEIAVASTVITYLKDWSKGAERAYRKKIDTLSRINHKNFLNLIGYCEEDEPFVRMMVFEYAPNGSLFEHLHVKEVELLDWSSRMRILMGIAYCIQHIHELNPPVAHTDLNSNAIFLTDDYAAKIGEISFWKECFPKQKMSGENESEHLVLPPLAVPETDIYNFGVLLLEIISGKVPYSKEQRRLENWATECLNGERNINRNVDPTLKSFNGKELDVIVEVVRECIQQDARKRPTMSQVIGKLKAVIDISTDQATPRLSPLWWAELEILSAEAA